VPIERNLALLEDYDLYQAFFLVGLRMFGDDWHGDREIYAKKNEASIESIQTRNQELINEKDQVLEEIKVFRRNAKNVKNPEKAALLDGMISEHWEQKAQLDNQIIDTGALDWEIRERDDYKRRIAVEEVLIEALKNGKIKYWALNSIRMDNAPWEKRDGCTYSIELSCIWWGKKLGSSYRRQFIRIRKSTFDLWLDQNYPDVIPEDENSTALEQAKTWFIEQLKKPQSSNWKRDKYIDYMTSTYGLSVRKSKSVWDQIAPSDMKKAGRPKSKQSRI
jgi:hypothetical protein